LKAKPRNPRNATTYRIGKTPSFSLTDEKIKKCGYDYTNIFTNLVIDQMSN
jgi:hypothetical protein